MQATGIHIDGNVIQIATLKLSGHGVRILETKTVQDVKPLYTTLERAVLVSGLPASDLLIRSFPLLTPPTRKLRKAIVLQAETQLHFKPEELISVPIFNLKSKQAAVYMTTKDALQQHLLRFRSLKLDPERVTAQPVALQRFIHSKAPELHSYFLIDIGHAECTCLWVEEDQIRKTYTLSFGLQHLKNAIQDDKKKMISLKVREEIDFTVLRNGAFPYLAEQARTLRRELSKRIQSFQTARPLVFTGEIEPHSGFRDFLLEGLREHISEEKKLGLSQEEERFALSIGLALDYLQNKRDPIQFRRGEHLSPQLWSKLGRFALLLTASSFLLSAGFYGLGVWWMNQREAGIIRNLEAWTVAKDPTLRLELFSVDGTTADLVDQWMRLIEKNGKDYPYLMKAPRVSQVLDWLTHHPLVESFRMAGDPMKIERFHYQLTRLPRLEQLQEPYAAKVELEFQIISPHHARKFHETLLQGDGWVDPDNEITWETLSNGYRTSFYLRKEVHDFH